MHYAIFSYIIYGWNAYVLWERSRLSWQTHGELPPPLQLPSALHDMTSAVSYSRMCSYYYALEMMPPCSLVPSSPEDTARLTTRRHDKTRQGPTRLQTNVGKRRNINKSVRSHSRPRPCNWTRAAPLPVRVLQDKQPKWAAVSVLSACASVGPRRLF